MTHDDSPWRPPPPSPPPQRPRTLLWVVLWAALAGIVLALTHAFPEAVQTRHDWASVAYAVGLVVLISAGVFRSRRILRPENLKYAAIWAAIIAVLALAFAYRSELRGVGHRLQLAFSAGDPVVLSAHEVVVPQGEDGGYWLVAKVNGQRVRFAIDTGATETVLSPADARRIGVEMANLRFIEEAESANGLAYGAPYIADRFEVGPFALKDFKLTVNQAPLSTSLLGMSFLRRLESFHAEDGKLVLRWREGS